MELLAVSPQGRRHPHADLEKPRTQPALFFLRRFFTNISTSHSYTDIWSRKEIFFFTYYIPIFYCRRNIWIVLHMLFSVQCLCRVIDGCMRVVPSQFTSDYPLILVPWNLLILSLFASCEHQAPSLGKSLSSGSGVPVSGNTCAAHEMCWLDYLLQQPDFFPLRAIWKTFHLTFTQGFFLVLWSNSWSMNLA